MPVNADYLATLRLQFDSANFVREAKKEYNEGAKVLKAFEKEASASMARLSALSVNVDVDFKGDPVGVLRTIQAEIARTDAAARKVSEFDLPYASRALQSYKDAKASAPQTNAFGDMQGTRETRGATEQLRKAGVRIDLETPIKAQIASISKQIDTLADTNPKFDLSAAIGSFETLDNAVKDFDKQSRESINRVYKSLDELKDAGVRFNLTGLKTTTEVVTRLHAAIEAAGAEFHEFGTFDLSKAQEEVRRMAVEMEKARVAGASMDAAVENISMNQPARKGRAGAAGVGGSGVDDAALTRSQEKLIQTRALVKELTGMDVEIEVRATNIGSFDTIRQALAKLEEDAKDVNLGINPNDVASAVGKIREMNNALRDTQLATAKATLKGDEYEEQVKQISQAWSQNAKEADAAGRVAQKQLAKTSLASQSAIRIIQDAPFGMLGMGNNIQQLSEEFGRLRGEQIAAANAAKVAIPTIGSTWKQVAMGMISGPMAIPFVITIITTLALSADKLASAWQKASAAFGLSVSKIGKDSKAMAAGVTEATQQMSELMKPEEMIQQATMLRSTLDSMNRNLNETAGIAALGFDGVNESVRGFIGMLQGANAAMSGQLGTFRATRAASSEQESAVKRLRTAYDEYNKEISKRGGRLSLIADLRLIGQEMDYVRGAVRNLDATLKDVRWEAYLANIRATTSGAAQVGALARAEAARGFDQSTDSFIESVNKEFDATASVTRRNGQILIAWREGATRAERTALMGVLRRHQTDLRTAARDNQTEAEQVQAESVQRTATRDDNAEAARLRRIETAADQASTLEDRLREMTEKVAQIAADAITRTESDGHQQRLLNLDAYTLRQKNALTQAAKTLGAAAVAGALAAIDRADAAVRSRENFARKLVEDTNIAAWEVMRTSEEAAIALARMAVLTTNPVEAARRALNIARVESRRETRLFEIEQKRVTDRIAALRNLRNTDNFGLEEQDELEGLIFNQKTEVAERARLVGEQRAEEIELTYAVRDAIIEESRAIQDRSNALRDFREETRGMAEDREGEPAGATGALGWLAALGDAANDPAVQIAAIGREARATAREEADRWAEQQRELADEVSRAKREEETAQNDPNATDAQRVGATAAVLGAMAAREDAEKAHNDRLTEIDRKAAAERAKVNVEARRAQVQMMMGVLSGFAQASESLYSTWASQREAELEREGVAEEERGEIIAREGRKRFMLMKGLRIAEAVANTISAGVSAFDSGMKSGLPAPFNAILAGAMLASTLAVGFAQVAQLRALQPDGSGANGGGGGGGGSLGAYSSLNGTVTAERVAAFEGAAGTSPGGQATAFNEAAERMEGAANRFEQSAVNLQATTTPATAERNFEVAAKRSASLNQ